MLIGGNEIAINFISVYTNSDYSKRSWGDRNIIAATFWRVVEITIYSRTCHVMRWRSWFVSSVVYCFWSLRLPRLKDLLIPYKHKLNSYIRNWWRSTIKWQIDCLTILDLTAMLNAERKRRLAWLYTLQIQTILTVLGHRIRAGLECGKQGRPALTNWVCLKPTTALPALARHAERKRVY